MRYVFLLVITILLVACSNQTTMPSGATPIPVEAIPTIDPTDTRLAQAQRDYNTYCAHCHGYGGEGQPLATIEQTESLGYHTVPLHNAAGHTWQHPDQLIFESIKYGVVAPTHLYEMISYDELLTDDAIFAIIDYMRFWWTDEQQAWQAQLTEQFTENNPYWADTHLTEDQQP